MPQRTYGQSLPQQRFEPGNSKYQKLFSKVFYCSEIPQGRYSTPIFEVQQYQPCSLNINRCNETGFLCCSFSAISITNSEHSNNKMHNVLPSIFALQYHTEYSYMFQYTTVHHHRINTNNIAQN